MMIMLPIKSIVFFLAMLFLPNDTSVFTATIEGEKIQWVKNDKVWSASNVKTGKALGSFSKKGNNITKVTPDGKKKTLKMGDLFELSKRMKVKNVEQIPLDKRNGFGLPIMIMKSSGQMILSQAKGVVIEKPILVQWGK